MKPSFYLITSLFLSGALFSSCQDGSVEHIAATKLVILQKVPIVENRLDENFRATLELLYPHECHDTVFIQDQIFLERIDLKVPYRHEFVIPPSLLRDFFGSNNPDKKKTLREALFFTGDTCFEQKPGKQFLAETEINQEHQPGAVSDYLTRNRKDALVYFISSDTLCRQYELGGAIREVQTDLARLNCRIVEDLKKKSKEDLLKTTVVIVLIPAASPDTSRNEAKKEVPANEPEKVIVASPIKEKPTAQAKPTPVYAKKAEVPGYTKKSTGNHSGCPPDSVVRKLNKQYSAIVTEFRNLLHYIATTNGDTDLKRKYREEAYAQIHRIPRVVIEGIPGDGLNLFLNSGFSENLVVTKVMDRCRVIKGIRIGEK